MGIKKTLGGDRVGTGRKMTVELENFGRSSHNQGKIIRTDQACGTIVPYYCNIGLTGTTFYMNASSIVRTLPTVGPIFGSMKQQIDFYQAPIRLYVAQLHNNALGIGLKMSNVKLPIFRIQANKIDYTKKGNPNSQQISQDSLLAYIGIRGLGNTIGTTSITRKFPAMFQLMYWDIYKNYYANKQEEIGMVITKASGNVQTAKIYADDNSLEWTAGRPGFEWVLDASGGGDILTRYYIVVNFFEGISMNKAKELVLTLTDAGGVTPPNFKDASMWDVKNGNGGTKTSNTWRYTYKGATNLAVKAGAKAINGRPENIAIESFPLSVIDEMREEILAAPKTAPFNIRNSVAGAKAPYNTSYGDADVNEKYGSGNNSYFSQAGLGLKTYLSDRFNNWLSTEWVDGVTGINEITAVDVSDGKLTMDALILSKKLFNMLNRVAISGGSYNDWQEAVYGVTTVRMAESPMYEGGYSSEIVFEEVVSNAAAETPFGDQPLGSLAGRGADRYSKGGNEIKIKCKEPSMIMVLGSFTPRIDYSQGNKWWNELETMDDFHKPDMDKIGFQELMTEEMAAFDTEVKDANTLVKRSAGKQPSWIEYMTEVNETYGSFSAGEELEFMALNRSYEIDEGTGRIKDLTTYIDPTKFNVAFADAKLSAKNLWVQVAIDCTARRVMSAKQIPNL